MEDTPQSLKRTERATGHKSKNKTTTETETSEREAIRTVKQLDEQPESVLSICVVECKSMYACMYVCETIW